MIIVPPPHPKLIQGSHGLGESRKTWEEKWSGKVREVFNFSKKSGNLFLNANYHEINQSHDFYLQNVMIIIS